MTTTTTTKKAYHLLRGEVLVWDGRRVKIQDVIDYGSGVEIVGVEIVVRRKFVLHYNTLDTPVVVEVRS